MLSFPGCEVACISDVMQKKVLRSGAFPDVTAIEGANLIEIHRRRHLGTGMTKGQGNEQGGYAVRESSLTLPTVGSSQFSA